MRITPSPVPWKSWVGAALVLAALGGCTVKPRPPVFSLYGHRGLVLTPFVNATGDKDLVGDFQPVFTQKLTALNALPLFESGQVGAFLRSQGKGPTQVDNDPDLLRALGAKYKADLVMTGVVDTYEETFTQEDPKRVIVDSKTGEAQWGFYTYRRVRVHATAKLKDPATGALLWSNGSSAYSYDNHWTVLPIPGEVLIPGYEKMERAFRLIKFQARKGYGKGPGDDDGPSKPGEILYPSDPKMAELRNNAIGYAARYLSDDFRGRGAWTPGLQTN